MFAFVTIQNFNSMKTFIYLKIIAYSLCFLFLVSCFLFF